MLGQAGEEYGVGWDYSTPQGMVREYVALCMMRARSVFL